MKNIQLKGDYNNNGSIDNNKEERANIVFNARDINNLQSELKRLKRRVNAEYNVSNNIVKDNANFASVSKIAEELTDGRQHILFNNVNKSVVFKNGSKPIASCIQIGTNNNSITNVNSLQFTNCQPINALTQTYTGYTEEQQQQSVPSLKVINDIVDNLSNLHTHKTDDISRDITRMNEEEEEVIETISLNDILDSKSDIGHIHAISDITNLQSTLDSKANVIHTHKTNDVSRDVTRTIVNANEEEEDVIETVSLNDILDSKSDVGHIHAISDITNLQSTIDSKANSIHTHKTNDITRDVRRTIVNANEEEEEITEAIPLNDILDGKSDINHNHNSAYAAIVHNHDERYALLTNIVSEIKNYVDNEEENEEEEEAVDESLLIPNVTAIKAYCADFLTPTSITTNAQLQALLKGGDGLSAFDVWKNAQTPKPQGEPDYTINDYLAAIKGAKGDTGATGADGLSAFQIWKNKQKPKDPDYTEEDFLKSLQAKDSVGEELVSYGLTAASFLASLYGDYSLQTQLTALQGQVTLLTGEVTTLLGEGTASDFVNTMDEIRSTTLGLSGYWNNIKTRAINGARTIRNLGSNIRASFTGYTHIVPV